MDTVGTKDAWCVELDTGAHFPVRSDHMGCVHHRMHCVHHCCGVHLACAFFETHVALRCVSCSIHANTQCYYVSEHLQILNTQRIVSKAQILLCWVSIATEK